MDIKKLDAIKSKFTYPPQNWGKLVDLWKNNEPISFYSWECPPRQIKEDLKNGKYVDFDVDIEAVVNGKMLDLYTEVPRLVSLVKKEQWFIKNIVLQNKNTSYAKIIADTNGLYLYPRSKQILGENKIKRLSMDFMKALESRVKELYPGLGFPELVLFTDIMSAFKDEYEYYFELIYKSFDSNLNSLLVSGELTKYWYRQMIDHVGMKKDLDKERLDVLKRAVATYGVEGMVFAIADTKNILPNPVWVNWEEKPESVQSTEILRQRYGIDPLPVIYFVKE